MLPDFVFPMARSSAISCTLGKAPPFGTKVPCLDIVTAPCAVRRRYRPRRRRGFRPAAPRPDFVPYSARPESAPIVWENNPPAQKRHKFLFGAWGYTRAPWRFPMNALPFFPPDAGRTISTLRVDDIRLCRTISTPAAWTIFASRGSQTMKPRNLFGFGASFTLAAIYSRGTCRPTTIDVLMFHFRVRNGTGWGHQAMTTRLLSYSLPRSSLLRNS